MSRIFAKGMTPHGEATIKINGNKTVESIECDNLILKYIIYDDIKNRENLVANYAPPSNSMLQAYATLCRYFGYANVKIEGDIGKIPSADKKGAIY